MLFCMRTTLNLDDKIMRLIKYYKQTGKLAEDWKLDRDKLKMYVE